MDQILFFSPPKKTVHLYSYWTDVVEKMEKCLQINVINLSDINNEELMILNRLYQVSCYEFSWVLFK